jgi:hypothetical protein
VLPLEAWSRPLSFLPVSGARFPHLPAAEECPTPRGLCKVKQQPLHAAGRVCAVAAAPIWQAVAALLPLDLFGAPPRAPPPSAPAHRLQQHACIVMFGHPRSLLPCYAQLTALTG